MGDSSPLGLHFSVELEAPADQGLNDDRVAALLTVSARSAARAGGAPAEAPAAEVLIMDRSLSMAGQGKLDEAKHAMCAAIDILRDGTYLGVIAGNHEAEVVYPPSGGLARVDATTKAAAKFRVIQQFAAGGTAIGSWLTRAGQLVTEGTPPGTVRHAVLYTDGKDEHETPEQLERALAACGDLFVCDARGVGHDWNHAELLRITAALHGEAKAVIAISDLEGDFTERVRQAQHVVVGRTCLALRLSDRFRVAYVRQNRPVEADLAPERRGQDGEIRVPLGSWSPGDRRQYQVSLRYAPDSLAVGEDVRAARIRLRAERGDGTWQECAEAEPLVVRRRSRPAFAAVQSNLTRAEDSRELGRMMRAVPDAADAGDWQRADRELRTAIQLAAALGDTTRLALLRNVSETAPDGVPRVRRQTPRGRLQRLGVESTRTGPAPESAAGLSMSAGEPAVARRPVRRRCRRGHWTTSPSVNFCEECGEPFEAEGEGPVDAR